MERLIQRVRLSGGSTGLLGQDAWRADWIGWETWEESAVRKAPATWIANPDVVPGSAKPNSEQIFAYLTSFNIDQPVERALLFATGEDTVWAWVKRRTSDDRERVSGVSPPPLAEVCTHGCDGTGGTGAEHNRV